MTLPSSSLHVAFMGAATRAIVVRPLEISQSLRAHGVPDAPCTSVNRAKCRRLRGERAGLSFWIAPCTYAPRSTRSSAPTRLHAPTRHVLGHVVRHALVSASHRYTARRVRLYAVYMCFSRVRGSFARHLYGQAAVCSRLFTYWDLQPVSCTCVLTTRLQRHQVPTRDPPGRMGVVPPDDDRIIHRKGQGRRRPHALLARRPLLDVPAERQPPADPDAPVRPPPDRAGAHAEADA